MKSDDPLGVAYDRNNISKLGIDPWQSCYFFSTITPSNLDLLSLMGKPRLKKKLKKKKTKDNN